VKPRYTPYLGGSMDLISLPTPSEDVPERFEAAPNNVVAEERAPDSPEDLVAHGTTV